MRPADFPMDIAGIFFPHWHLQELEQALYVG